MDINIIPPEKSLPLDRAYIVNIVIKSFKGRKDVEVHLYRPEWDEAEEKKYDWDRILSQSLDSIREDLNKSKQVVMETYTLEERDQLVDYLEKRYSDRLKVINSVPLSFPVPAGLMPLSLMQENENHGRIKFDLVPNYTLNFPVHGFYDLSAHSPILASDDV
ncbi:MAG: hypothetical protein ABR542_00365 [Desulfonatronovibrio sp.]|nr:hypothetical protein [Desulfovibrionales bacterium]